LNAQIGAFYIHDEDTKELNRIGSYAFPEDAKVKGNIRMGEGLAGQAALEKEINLSIRFTR